MPDGDETTRTDRQSRHLLNYRSLPAIRIQPVETMLFRSRYFFRHVGKAAPHISITILTVTFTDLLTF
jgi:hypothetical protein